MDEAADPPGPDAPPAHAGLPVLPDAVRRHLAELAATVLGELDDAEVPAGLRRVRGFVPARRARAGANPLGVALDREPMFRQRVAAAWRALHPELAEMLDAGQVPPAADPHAVVVGAYLLRREGWEDVVSAAVAVLSEAGGDSERHRERAEVLRGLEAARRDLTRARAELAAERERAAALEEELAALRRELRRHRSDADRARAAARAAEQAAEQVRAQAEAEAATARERTEEADKAVRAAREREELSRRAAREGRTLADVRARALPADDPAALETLVTLPHAHLVVDGYNVTKSAYPALALAEQRRRLVEGLAPLAARTGAEVTCVFDGADVDARPTSLQRGVRVVFSEPGVTADEKIRRLVRAEPRGRVVVVVSSDGEVASGVRASGARPVASAALVRLLARG